MTFKVLKEEHYKDYIKLLNNEPGYVFQTITYLNNLKELGHSFKIFGMYKEDVLTSALPIQIKKIPLVKRYIYTIPMGMIGANNQEFLHTVINMFKRDAYKINIGSIRQLDFLDNETLSYTSNINLNHDLDELFNKFSKTARNCVRKGIKEGVTVEIKKDITAIDLFISLYEQMIKRKSIKSINIKFLRNVLNDLVKEDLGFFAVASFQETIYNIAFISTVGKRARYLYGASLIAPQEAPPIGQLLHYEIIKHLKENDYKIYDLGGISSYELNKDHPSYGVDKFKLSFGGTIEVVTYNYVYYKNWLLKQILK